MTCPCCLKESKNPVLKDSNFVKINPGAFLRKDVWVSLTVPFLMQKTPVTQGQWKAVMGDNPSYFKKGGDDCPVERVSWNDTQEFIRKLNQMEGKDVFRLPTEAEWEYASRAGSDRLYCFGDDEALLSDYAWYEDNSDSKTHPVGTKKPNAWGLYDMHGNVWEWCEDWYGEYPSGSEINPAGPSEGSIGVFRGGSWISCESSCCCAFRGKSEPDFRCEGIGCRLVKTDPIGPETGSYHVLRGGSFYFDGQKCRCDSRNLNGPGDCSDNYGFRLAKDDNTDLKATDPGPENVQHRKVLRGGGWISVARRCCCDNRINCSPGSRGSNNYHGFRLVKEVTDPAGPETGTLRVLRGGSWGTDAQDCCCANRGGESLRGCCGHPYGFRLVKEETND